MIESPTPQQPSLHDQLEFGLLFSFALHVIIIFGVVFNLPKIKLPASQTLEITLAKHHHDETPKKVDFLAAQTQAGGGTTENLYPTQHPQASTPYAPSQQVNNHNSLHRESRQQSQADLSQVSTSNTDWHSQQLSNKPNNNAKVAHNQAATLSGARQQQIAALTSQITHYNESSSKRPKIRAVSVATHESRDAKYLDAWRKRVEFIGNLHYPDEARRAALHGSLRLLVALNGDGSVRYIKIRQSSGHRVLDDAALQIVRLASPFAPLPEAIRQDTDVLEIIRTWVFTKGNQVITR